MTVRQAAVEMGQRMADKFAEQNKGRLIPLTQTEFAGMMAIAFEMGYEVGAGLAEMPNG